MTMSECTHDCSTCGASCEERQEPQDLHKPANELSSIKKVIAVVSGKGGVGKSTVTCSPAPPFPRPSASTTGQRAMSWASSLP